MGSNIFQVEGGVQILISIELVIFQGGDLDPISPPLDPRMEDADFMLVGPCSRVAAHIDWKKWILVIKCYYKDEE